MGCCLHFTLPLFEDRLHLWVLVQQGLRQQVAVIGCGLVNGAMFPRLSQDGQRLHHQPCGIVGIFNGEFLLGGACREQARQVDGLHPWLVLGIRHRLRDILLVGQDSQIVLFAIGEPVESWCRGNG